MHIGIVHYAAPPTVGGVELTLFHHARLLLAMGHEVTVVAGKGDAFLPGVRYREEPLVGSRSEPILAAARALAQGQLPAAFDELVAETRSALMRHLATCDVVIGHNLFTLHKNLALTAAVHSLAARGEGPPWVAWHHDFAWLRPQYQPELHPGQPWELLRHPWPGVRHVTVSESQRGELARLYGIPEERITVVPPGVEPCHLLRCSERVGTLLARWRLLESDCLFLLPARITRRKNIELAIEWLAAIRARSGWDARLLVTGPPGPHNPTNAAYLEQLLALRTHLQLEGAVHFAYQAGEGPPLLLDDEEVATLFDVADALLFTSQQEGFGIPILEAGLLRLPIFATDLPPFRESAGALATLLDPQLAPGEIASIVIDTLERDRAFQLRRRILSRFTWRRLVEGALLPLLQETIATSHSVTDTRKGDK